MGPEISDATKMAISVTVLVFIVSVGIVLVMIGQSFFNASTVPVDSATSSSANSDLYYIASYTGKNATPMASLLNWLSTPQMSTQVGTFTLKEPDGAGYKTTYYYEKLWRPDFDYRTVLSPYMDKKIQLNWNQDQDTGLYNLEVYIVS